MLNKEIENTIPGCTLAAYYGGDLSLITLPAGQYHLVAHSNFRSGSGTLKCQTRIKISAGGAILLVSEGHNGANLAESSTINGSFTLAASSTITLQYWVDSTADTYLGYATGGATAGSYWAACVSIMKIDETIGLGATGPTGPIGPTGAIGPTGPVGLVGIGGATGAYTLALTDNGKLVDMDKATAVTLTVPKNAVVAFPIGTSIAVRQKGAGQVTIAPVDGDVTLNYPDGLKTTNQYAMAQLIKIAINTWQVYGSLET
jgi:hypothetical protein